MVHDRRMSMRIAAVGTVLLLGVSACGGEPAPRPSPSPAPACSESVGGLAAPADGYRVVAGAVAVPTDRVLGVASSGESAPTPKLFAKWGLLVRTGATVEVTVESGPALIGWGTPGVPAASVRITACPEGAPPQPWTAFAGGTWLAAPACVPLVIRAGDEVAPARMPIGAPCA
jgi:hypothetical protein